MKKRSKPIAMLGLMTIGLSTFATSATTVYAIEDTSNQKITEQSTLPSLSDPLNPTDQDKQVPQVFFGQSNLAGKTHSPIQLNINSTIATNQVKLKLPSGTEVLQDQLNGNTEAKHIGGDNWLLSSSNPQTIFTLPVSFDEAGEYTLVANETSSTKVEISDVESITSSDVLKESTESSVEQTSNQESSNSESTTTESSTSIEQKKAPEVSESSTAPEKDKQAKKKDDKMISSESAKQTNDLKKAKDDSEIFVGSTVQVKTFEELRLAVANPGISIIDVQGDLVRSGTGVATAIGSLNHDLWIQGNGHKIDFGADNGTLNLSEVDWESTLRIENSTITKAGTTPLVKGTAEVSKNWVFELANIKEVDANTLRLTSLPQGKVSFIGGVSDFTRTTSTQTFVEAKEVSASNKAKVTISRGNATIFFSAATVATPKLTIEDGASIEIYTAAGTANTIDFRGSNPEVIIQSQGNLEVNTAGTTASPSNTSNNAISLTGIAPKISVVEQAKLTTWSSLAKRGIHLSGNDAKVTVNDSNLNIESATQAAVNIAGDNSIFSLINSNSKISTTTGVGIGLTGSSPMLKYEGSTAEVTSTTGQRINLIGSTPNLLIQNSQLKMNATSGRGIFLQGATPNVQLDGGNLEMIDNGTGQQMILDGTDALVSLANESNFNIARDVSSGTENVLIGNNKDRPELKITGKSNLSVDTKSLTSSPSDTTNNAVHVRGKSPIINLSENSKIEVNSRAGWQTGLRISGGGGLISVDSSFINTTDCSVFSYDQLKVSIKNKSEINLENTRNQNVTHENTAYSSLLKLPSDLDWTMESSSKLNIKANYGGGVSTTATSATAGESSTFKFIIRDAELNIFGGNNDNEPLFVVQSRMIDMDVVESGKFIVKKLGKSFVSDINGWRSSQAVYLYATGNNPEVNVNVEGIDSSLDVFSEMGPALAFSTRNVFSGHVSHRLNVGPDSSFNAVSKMHTGVAFNLSGPGDGKNAFVFSINNPLFYNIVSAKGYSALRYANQHHQTGKIIGQQTNLSLWKKDMTLDREPDLSYKKLNFEIGGKDGKLDSISQTDNPNFNMGNLGNTGLMNYSKWSASNGGWAIADELRVPTNADKKIYGHVSVSDSFSKNRDARTNEAEVDVRVTKKDGTEKEYSARTIGNSTNDPGLSSYGETPRGGLFEIKLPEVLEAGDTVKIIGIELTDSEQLAEGHENLIETSTVTVFPVVPPKPVLFNSNKLPKDAQFIQGHSENPDVEVSASFKGKPIDTSGVQVNENGDFAIPVKEISKQDGDVFQVFLRDKYGSAAEAGVLNPPVTNDSVGNINPKASLDYHDVTFDAASEIVVGKVDPVPPMDSLDPDKEVDPENKPNLPTDQGLLSIDFASSFNFGEQKISTKAQQYFAKPQRLLNSSGKVDEKENRPNYVQISDRRVAQERFGWELSVTQIDQFVGKNGKKLNGAQVGIANQELVTANGKEEPSLVTKKPISLTPGSKQNLIKSGKDEGSGTWLYRFGNKDTADKSVSLDVPKEATPDAQSYQTTFNWELNAVPENK